jgi:hypothetical protein
VGLRDAPFAYLVQPESQYAHGVWTGEKGDGGEASGAGGALAVLRERATGCEGEVVLVLTGRPSRWEVRGGVRKVESREGGELVWLHMGVIGVGVNLGEEEVGVGLNWGEEGCRIHDTPGGRWGVMGNDTVEIPRQGRWVDDSEFWTGLNFQGLVPRIRCPQFGCSAAEEKSHTMLDQGGEGLALVDGRGRGEEEAWEGIDESDGAVVNGIGDGVLEELT